VTIVRRLDKQSNWAFAYICGVI